MWSVPLILRVKTRDAVRVYDFFEAVTEAAMDNLSFVWLKARSLEDTVIFYLQAESNTDLSALAALADTCTYEEGVWRFSMRIKKAGEQA